MKQATKEMVDNYRNETGAGMMEAASILRKQFAQESAMSLKHLEDAYEWRKEVESILSYLVSRS